MHTKAEYCTVYDRIGRPAYSPAEALTKDEMKMAAEVLQDVMKENLVEISFCDGPYDDEVVYRFITEELFLFEITKKPIAGMVSSFVYEEYHPNHPAEIQQIAHAFFHKWFSRDFSSETLLAEEIITADGKQLHRDELIEKLSLFFDAFENFSNDAYNIDDTSFKLRPEDKRGFGFAEGRLKYEAALEKGEKLYFEGPYKLYMQMEFDEWSVYYFVMPGFTW